MISQNWSQLKSRFAKRPLPTPSQDGPSKKRVRVAKKSKSTGHRGNVSKNQLQHWIFEMIRQSVFFCTSIARLHYESMRPMTMFLFHLRIGLELGRWNVMDELVAGYELHISPSLGGADSSRNEQKRKRHLEAWWLFLSAVTLF